MSLLDEEEVFQKADKHIDNWKKNITKIFNASFFKDDIAKTIGYPKWDFQDYDYENRFQEFWEWVNTENRWIYLDAAIDTYEHIKHSMSNSFWNFIIL